MRKKICVITTTHPALDNRIFNKEIKSFLKNYDVFYITTENISADLLGLNVQSIGYFSGKIFKRIAANFKAFQKSLKVKADCYHFHEYDFLPYAYLLKVLKRKPVIYDMHEDYVALAKTRSYIPNFLKSFLSSLVYFFENIFSRSFSAVIVVDEKIKDKKSHLNKKIVIISNYPRKEDFNDFNLKNYKKVTNPKLVHLGNLNEIRGADTIIGGLSEFGSGKLTVIGDVKPENYKNQLVEKQHIEIETTGWQEYQKALKIAYIADIAVIGFLPVPNHLNCSPNKIFDYMGLGLPILSSDIDSLKNIVEKEKVGLTYISDSKNDFARKLEELISDSNKMEIYAKNARKAFENKYNWNKEEEKLLNLYEEIIGK